MEQEYVRNACLDRFLDDSIGLAAAHMTYKYPLSMLVECMRLAHEVLYYRQNHCSYQSLDDSNVE